MIRVDRISDEFMSIVTPQDTVALGVSITHYPDFTDFYLNLSVIHRMLKEVF